MGLEEEKGIEEPTKNNYSENNKKWKENKAENRSASLTFERSGALPDTTCLIVCLLLRHTALDNWLTAILRVPALGLF